MAARALLAWALAILAGPAFAFADVRSEYGANISIVRVDSVTAPSRAGRVLTTTGSIAGPGGSSVTTGIQVSMRNAAIARAAARVIPVVAVGMAIYDIMKDMRAEIDNGQVKWDPGVPKTQMELYYCQAYGQNSPAARTGYEACEKFLPQLNQVHVTGGCYNQYTEYQIGAQRTAWSYWIHTKLSAFQVVPGPCTMPATLDDPQGGIAGIGNLPQQPACQYGEVGGSEYDGRCQSTEDPSYSGTMTPDDFGEAAAGHPDAGGVDWPGVLGDVVEAAGDTVAIPTEGEPSRTADPKPAPIPGPVTTTQHADGTVTETATGWHLSHAADFLNPGKAGWNRTTTTTKKDSQGNVISTETSTIEPALEGKADDVADGCAENPNRAGCAELGEPEEFELPESERSVTVDADPGWSGGECPAPTSLNLGFGSITYDNELVCTALGWIKPLLIVSASIAAALIVIGGFKQ